MTIGRALLCAVLTAAPLAAQDVDLALRPPRDSALARARSMVTGGDAEAGRKVVDSVLAANANDAAMYPEALFWRGVLAGTAAEAERSYRRLLIEAPLSDRAEEALLQLAQLEASRGNRRAASDHLYRYMLSYGNSEERPARGRVSLWLVRLLFEQPDQMSRGCEAVKLSRDAIPVENIELRNQLEVYAPRCAYAQAQSADTATPAPAPPPPASASQAPPRTRPATQAAAPRQAAAGATVYSVQVAAYDSREAATRMADVLVSRGLDARVDGRQQPFRVRIGRFATRAEAVRLQQTLKSQGQGGFVTAVPRP
ncbi:MAG TPA: SPOR domain-containing protein [Gemmatimonadaceae bacterium]|nr:SPOR domain-containing protein [Gemmatimonadaceae bacterium]